VLVRDTVPQTDARVFTDEAAETLVLAVGTDAAGCNVVPTSIAVHHCTGAPLGDALAALGERGIGELLIEPGPRLLTSLWEAGLIDRMVVVSAGGFAGAEAPSVYVGAPDSSGDDLTAQMRPVEAGIVGDVSVTVWEPQSAAREQK
jgi:riboflavin biosynthesis pyrimidine reductase